MTHDQFKNIVDAQIKRVRDVLVVIKRKDIV